MVPTVGAREEEHKSHQAVVIDGKALAERLRQRITQTVGEWIREGRRPPALSVVQVGDLPASTTYVRHKVGACRECGIRSEHIRLPATVSQKELIAAVGELNRDPEVDGIIVQLPLPDHIDPHAVSRAISPEKDVDCLHPENFGLLAKGTPRFVSCTPRGILHALTEYRVPIEGAHLVVVGRSLIVGRPLALLMLSRNATVTICHSRTRELATLTRQADILVSAVGKPGLIGPDMVRPGAAVVDVGITQVEVSEGGKRRRRLVGDVKFEDVRTVAGWITPVPGGVGPLTVAMLLMNTLDAYRMREKLTKK